MGGPTTLAARAGLLMEHATFGQPSSGAGPWPVAFLLHGCGGRQRFLERYAKVAHDAGWATLVIDSLAPRGIGRAGAITTVCTGVRLRGAERAGDLFAMMDWARRNPALDGRCMAAAGWSHGGWAIMDGLATAGRRAELTRLTDLALDPLEGLRGAFLVYPWCGPTSSTAHRGWDRTLPVHAIIAGRDSVSIERDTLRALGRLGADGVPVTSMRFDEATHAFDADDAKDPRFRHDPALETRAHGAFAAFLTGLGAG